MSESRIGPVDQSYYIAPMEAFGYPVDQEGMCHGYSWEAAYAILTRTEAAFIDRCHALYEYQQHNLDVAQIRETKQLDTLFRGIAVHHQPELFPDISVNGKHLSMNTPLTTIDYLYPQPADENKRIEQITSFSGLYNEKDFVTYLETFRKKLKQSFPAGAEISPIAIVMESGDHTVTVGYDFLLDSWIIYDANFIPKDRISNDIEMAKNLITSFYNSEFVPVGTSIFSLKANSHALSAACDSWLQEIEEINAVTKEKAQFCTSDGSSWLYAAIRKEQIETVDKLLAHGADPNIHNLADSNFTPLGMAAQSGNLEIVKSLVKAHAIIDEPIYSDGKTALYVAVFEGHVDIVKYLLEVGADDKITIKTQGTLGMMEINLTELIAILIKEEEHAEKRERYIEIENLLVNKKEEIVEPAPVIDWQFFAPASKKPARIWENDAEIDGPEKSAPEPINWVFQTAVKRQAEDAEETSLAKKVKK